MQQQREKRATLRTQVAEHIEQMDQSTLARYEEEFQALALPNATLPDALHDFIAEQEELGNPYPALRALRMKANLLNHI